MFLLRSLPIKLVCLANVLLFISPFLAAADTCPLSGSQIRSIKKCEKEYIENDCESLVETEDSRKLMSQCTLNDIKSDNDQNSISVGCGTGIRDTTLATIEMVENFSAIATAVKNGVIDEKKRLESICDKLILAQDREFKFQVQHS